MRNLIYRILSIFGIFVILLRYFFPLTQRCPALCQAEFCAEWSLMQTVLSRFGAKMLFII